jgi:uncharacterized protein (DUF1499 family)
MVEALTKRRRAVRLTWLAVLLSFGAVAAALIAAVGTGRGAWDFRTGLSVLRYAFFAGIGGLLLALIAIFAARRAQPKLVLASLLALVVALAFVLYVGNLVRIARSVPAIHDISTDVEDWPRFYRLTVRADNLENIPDMGRAELAALPPRERWKAIHREHYGDIATIRLPWDVPETVARVRALAAEARGWEIVTTDPRNGIVEAVDTSFFFRFKDNVVVRVRPAPGGGSLVDMRSISRVGVSDVGVNARRVRDFLADLQRG